MKKFLKRSFGLGSSKKSTKKGGKKKVSFESKKPTAVFEVPNREDYDADLVWCSRTTDQEYTQVLELMKCSIPLSEIEDRGYCTRGLEIRAKKVMRRTMERKNKSEMVVFNQQRIQKKVGIYNPDRIAEVYRSISKRCIEDAVSAAKRDATQALEIYEQQEVSERVLAEMQKHKSIYTERVSTTPSFLSAMQPHPARE